MTVDAEPHVVPELESEPQSELEDEVAPEDVEPANRSTPEQDSALVITQALARIEAKLAESQRLLDRQADVSSRLHAENQTLRSGELRKAQLPLVLNVLRVYDDITRMAETATEASMGDDLRLAAEAMTDALERSGVEALPVIPGEPFNAKRHKVTAIDPSTEPDAERAVSRVLRTGFAWTDGELVRVSEVAVHKYAPPAEAAEDPQPSVDGVPADLPVGTSDGRAAS